MWSRVAERLGKFVPLMGAIGTVLAMVVGWAVTSFSMQTREIVRNSVDNMAYPREAGARLEGEVKELERKVDALGERIVNNQQEILSAIRDLETK